MANAKWKKTDHTKRFYLLYQGRHNVIQHNKISHLMAARVQINTTPSVTLCRLMEYSYFI